MLYPLAFERDLVKPKQVVFNNQKLVLWKGKNVTCMPDKCTHRAAELSKGCVRNNKIECPYHGWTFNETGRCTHVPQLIKGRKQPKSCDMTTFPVSVYDGIVWMADTHYIKSLPEFKKEFKPFYITDQAYYLPYSYELQIENLLDPAHLHFVHDGFQGNRNNACPIKLESFYENDDEIFGYFIHMDNTTPDLSIRFYKPGVVDVSVINKETRKLMRKNVIYVSPGDGGHCNVLFRDITVNDAFVGLHEYSPLFEKNYKRLNRTVIDLITDQDLKVIQSQSSNIREYCNAKYVLPCEGDRMIVAFRKWFCKMA
jgi:phenylpropionate dioxygenase-like ring-hydroxylating dioxygenase large terminal subunit